MLLYYITDRQQFAGNEEARRKRLLAKIAEAARAGVDYIQLRERDLTTRELEELARAAIATVRSINPTTKLLINSRTDVALAVGADGVHLRSTDISAGHARAIWGKAPSATGLVSHMTSYNLICHPEPSEGPAVPPHAQAPEQVVRFAQDDKSLGTAGLTIAVSCHTREGVRTAEAQGADFAVFGPILEKTGAREPGSGLGALREACQHAGRMPVLALGGATLQNARMCLEAGAAGIAGIRLFQDYDLEETVAKLWAIVTQLTSSPAR